MCDRRCSPEVASEGQCFSCHGPQRPGCSGGLAGQKLIRSVSCRLQPRAYAAHFARRHHLRPRTRNECSFDLIDADQDQGRRHATARPALEQDRTRRAHMVRSSVEPRRLPTPSLGARHGRHVKQMPMRTCAPVRSARRTAAACDQVPITPPSFLRITSGRCAAGCCRASASNEKAGRGRCAPTGSRPGVGR